MSGSTHPSQNGSVGGHKRSGSLTATKRICEFQVFNTLFFALTTFFTSFSIASSGSGITYHGRIIKPDGTPLEGNVEFKFQIRTPGTENCLLYEETQSKQVTNGMFALVIGQGTPGANSLVLEKVFQNRGTLSGLTDCASGFSSYATDTTHGRRLIISFRDLTNGPTSWEEIPETTINFVPLAIEAQSVGGFNAKHLLRVEDGSGPQDVPSFTPSEADELLKLAKGTSTLYLTHSSDAGATLPAYSGNPSSPTQGSIWFDTSSGELKYYNGTTVITVGSGNGSGTVTSITAGAGLIGGTITTSGTIALEDHGTPGTYYKVTTDAKGRVTSGSATLDAADIPSLDWSKIDSGKPTTIDGYGITDAVKNLGGVVSIQSGDDASKPAAGTAGRIYVATDTQKIYRDDGASWIVVASVDAGGGGGTVTEVTVGGAPLSVTNGTTTPQISISQAGASSSGYLSQADWNTFNSKLDSSLEAGQIYVGNSSNVATARTPSGDVSMNESGSFTVQKIQGSSVSGTTPVDGQVLKYIGGTTNEWQPANFSIGDLKTSGGVQQFANATCSKSQTLSWNSLTDQFTCVNIEISASQVSDLGTMAAESKDDYLTKAGNLSGLANVATARTNLGFTATGNSLVTATDAAAARTAMSAMAHVAPGTSGNVLQSDGTNWVSAPLSLSASDIPNLDASKITSGTLNIARIPTGATAATVAVGNDSRFPSSACGAGKKMRWDGLAWQCEDDDVTDSTKVAKAGDSMTGTLELPSNGLVVGTDQLVVSGGKVGIGTASPSAKLQVEGAVVSTTKKLSSGATVDLSTSNTHVLNSVGGSTITLTNMVDGGTYNIVVADTTSRTYTFSGCNNSYFKPANAATTASSRTIYGILTIRNGSNWDCYINWSSGYQ